ncbi:MAG: two-component system nitrate/nitrite response regulator NarL [Cryomorphaceae bacterium]|jgi:two-component system nitrate/nitrite response regulator NarL
MQAKHILIVDDHALFRTGMKMILTQVGQASGVSEASSIKEAFEFTEHDIDIILLDVHLPGVNGIDGIKPMRDKYAGVPIVILSASTDPSSVAEARALGASGFLHKATMAEEMVASINTVFAGGTCFSSDLEPEDYEHDRSLSNSLTPRQIEVLIYLCEGKPNKLIARELGMSENTVRVHVSAILNALGASNRSEAILIAQREGITS